MDLGNLLLAGSFLGGFAIDWFESAWLRICTSVGLLLYFWGTIMIYGSSRDD